MAQTGWRILNLLASVATESSDLEPLIEETLQKRWLPRTPQAAELIRTALIVCADHELNVSSFTARCVASSGANPYSVVVAGLAAHLAIGQAELPGRRPQELDAFRREQLGAPAPAVVIPYRADNGCLSGVGQLGHGP